MNPSKTESQSDNEILLTRVVEAPRDLVWRIWTEPSHVHLWWGPTGFTTTTHEMQVRPGGRWRYTMHGPDGHDYPNLITYLEIVEPSRIVYEHGGEAGLEPVSFKTIVTFEELSPTQTRVTMQSIFPSARQRDFVVEEYGAIEGGKQTLARMAEHAVAQLSGESEPDELVLRRVLRAPRPLVYEVWTSGEHLAGWFGPKGCTLEVPAHERSRRDACRARDLQGRLRVHARGLGRHARAAGVVPRQATGLRRHQTPATRTPHRGQLPSRRVFFVQRKPARSTTSSPHSRQ